MLNTKNGRAVFAGPFLSAPMIRFIVTTLLLVLGVVFEVGHSMSLSANSSPFVTNVTAAATSGGSEPALTLVENSTTNLYVHGTISDADGCADVATNGSVAGKFYRTNHLNADLCSADNNDCYTISNVACVKTGCDGPGDTVFTFECTAQIQYYADTTVSGPHSGSDWTAKITATDAATATGSQSDTIEMNSTVALDVTPSIDYGTINLGVESAQKTLTITNTGNSGIDIDVSGSGSMNCQSGSIPVENAHYSQSQGFAYAAGTPLAQTATEVELNLANQTNDAATSTKDMYFVLKNPALGVGGTCANTLTISARADTENGW